MKAATTKIVVAVLSGMLQVLKWFQCWNWNVAEATINSEPNSNENFLATQRAILHSTLSQQKTKRPITSRNISLLSQFLYY